MRGSISTVPGDLQRLGRGPRCRRSARTMSAMPRTSSACASATGKDIALALEPEPNCFLETLEETARYFEEELFGEQAISLMAELTGLLARRRRRRAPPPHRRLLRRLPCGGGVRAGARAPRDVPRQGHPHPEAAAELRAESRRASTARRRRSSGPSTSRSICTRWSPGTARGFKRYLDLPEALADLDAKLGSEWRIHFHVPIFLAGDAALSPPRRISSARSSRCISSSRSPIIWRSRPIPGTCCRSAIAASPVAQAIARELNWVREPARRMTFADALRLGRVSNLPTVWTNALAGMVLGGGLLAPGR